MYVENVLKLENQMGWEHNGEWQNATLNSAWMIVGYWEKENA